MKLTRRKLALALFAAREMASRPAPQQPSDDDLKARRDLMRANAAAVAKVEIPMAAEPAFQFKA
ncbi:MAG TPA: hypothetical protein VMS37_23930 [Verrucomicrobiae bacterium]|nr:hypothetical protein [Verrucomicrobiae bacterium]